MKRPQGDKQSMKKKKKKVQERMLSQTSRKWGFQGFRSSIMLMIEKGEVKDPKRKTEMFPLIWLLKVVGDDRCQCVKTEVYSKRK